MEQVGAFPSGEWEPLTMLFSNEELEMAQRLLGQYPSGHQVIDAAVEGCTATQMPGMCEALFGSAFLTPNTGAFLDYSQESSYCSGNDISRGAFYAPVATPSTDNCGGEYYCYYDQMQVMNEVSVPMDAGDSFVPDFNSILMDESVGLGENAGSDEVGKLDESQPPADNHQAFSVPEVKKLQLKRKSAAKTSELSTVDEDSNADDSVSENPKKKSRVSRDKSKKNPQPRRKQKARSDNSDGESNARQEGQSSSVCNSEDDTVSEELNGESTPSLNSDGKARASRGSATDPQSLYARKRRERINERLRILQNLVPNGTKVDISTMLEEAVHYVKFLQLQIKLLSSDELWMYAPIAYNGMDIGLNQLLCPQL